MTFLLMVFLAVVCLNDNYPAALWGGPIWLPAGLTGVTILMIACRAAFLARHTRRRIVADSSGIERELQEYDQARFVHSMMILACFLATLFLFGWGHFVRGEPDSRAGSGTELLLLAPYLLSLLASWFFFYEADRAVHQLSVARNDEDSLVSSFGSRWSYIAFQFRQRIALAFVPVLLLIIRQEVYRLFPDSFTRGGAMAYIVSISVMISIFLTIPLLIRVVLGLKPMPPGPLRDRLMATAKRLGFRFTGVMVWDTRQGFANAMIVGVIPWLRYVVFTDRMIRDFTPEEVQAVFGHELGHVKHQHILFYLLFLTTSTGVLALVSEHYLLTWLEQGGNQLANLWPDYLPEDLGEWIGPKSSAAIVLVAVLLIAYIFIAFGRMSQGCERQADIYGCRAVSCGRENCTGHKSEMSYSPAGTLCSSGIRTFAEALDKVAIINGMERNRPGFLQSWQHSTIALRVEFLQGMIVDPQTEPHFQMRLRRSKWMVMTILVITLAILIGRHGW